TIQGTVAQDVRLGVYRNFQGVGQVVSCPTITRTGVTNGVNPFDVALSFGNPYAGQTGAILFTTNSAFIPGSNSRLDLVSTSLNSQNGVLTIVPDSNLAGTSRNIFNATSGLTALPFAVYNGSMDVEFPNGGKSVVGKVDVLGFLGTNFYGRYVANFSGTLVSNIQCPNPS
ncbi:MAG: hypothetical protein JOZ78_27095, partial [Chroococcidiopsidaceae cyanobacterium CP_BM_ER_R8_30]|nr:hypothetical protein [Chroococcidiopsidaceae cyanobacterium CP_BM_ER_R8_30]